MKDKEKIEQIFKCLEAALCFENASKKSPELSAKLRIENSKISKELLTKCVKSISEVPGENGRTVDSLMIFYGDGVYENLIDVHTAIDYLFVADITASTYATLYAKKPAKEEVGGWVTCDPDLGNKKLKDFFKWLGTPNRTLSREDGNAIKAFHALIDSPTRLECEMRESTAKMSPVQVIKGITYGTIRVSGDGVI